MGYSPVRREFGGVWSQCRCFSITAFDRAVVTAAESQLRKNNATGENLFWILSAMPWSRLRWTSALVELTPSFFWPSEILKSSGKG